MMQREELSPELERPDASGEAARVAAGQLVYPLDLEQQCCGGLNFGYFYDQSPIVAYDGEQAPGYTMGTFTSSTVPGCRAPHIWLAGQRSLYDAMGPDYTLLRLDPTAHVAGIVAAEKRADSARRYRREIARGIAALSAQAGAGASGPTRRLAWRRGAGRRAQSRRSRARRRADVAGAGRREIPCVGAWNFSRLAELARGHIYAGN